ncbi:MAG: phosphoribosyltransferase [Fusicatenibacter sp.]|nr:phosphoribosyltransferase [Fusicatenibacter sp.]
MKNWEAVKLVPEFSEQGVDCYRLEGGDYVNEYYVVSEAETRKLLNTPEIVGYEVYHCLIPATSQMLYYFKEQKKVTTANILSILRGALNYPLEESCYREHIRVHDISFLSSERVFQDDEIAGLEIKYSKLTMVPGSTLLIGDIIATGETLIHCLRYVTDFYREHGAALRNIIIFTIGGTTGITILERLTAEIREFWPDFEGFITVYYEGIFSTYQDKGVSGINLPDVDFYWKGGIVAPEFRRQTLSMRDPLFEKCIIYDGGARRYEIHEHVEEVLDFWNKMLVRADRIDFKKLLEEKLGYPLPVTYEEWIHYNHYEKIAPNTTKWLYQQEKGYVESLQDVTLKEIAQQRIDEFTSALHKYML